jgi:hypothetical protein
MMPAMLCRLDRQDGRAAICEAVRCGRSRPDFRPLKEALARMRHRRRPTTASGQLEHVILHVTVRPKTTFVASHLRMGDGDVGAAHTADLHDLGSTQRSDIRPSPSNVEVGSKAAYGSSMMTR